MDYEKLLKSYRKKNLAKLEDFPDRVNYGLPDIKKLIPHREPFLFLDNILGIDLHQGQIIGTRYISGDDPIFETPDFSRADRIRAYQLAQRFSRRRLFWTSVRRNVRRLGRGEIGLSQIGGISRRAVRALGGMLRVSPQKW